MDQNDNINNAWDLTCLKTPPVHSRAMINDKHTNYYVKNQVYPNESENSISKFSEFSTVGGVIDMSSNKITPPNKISVIKNNSIELSQNCRLNNKVNNQIVHRTDNKNKITSSSKTSPNVINSTSSSDSNRIYSLHRNNVNTYSQITSTTTDNTSNQDYPNFSFMNKQHPSTLHNFTNTQYNPNPLLTSSQSFTPHFTHSSSSHNNVKSSLSNDKNNSHTNAFSKQSHNCDQKNNYTYTSSNNNNFNKTASTTHTLHRPQQQFSNPGLAFVRSDVALDSIDVESMRVQKQNAKYDAIDNEAEVYSISDDDEEDNDEIKVDEDASRNVKNLEKPSCTSNRLPSTINREDLGKEMNVNSTNIIEDEGIVVCCGGDQNTDVVIEKIVNHNDNNHETNCNDKNVINDNVVDSNGSESNVIIMDSDDNHCKTDDSDIGVAVNERVSFHSFGDLMKSNDFVIELNEDGDNKHMGRRKLYNVDDDQNNVGVTITKKIDNVYNNNDDDEDDDVVEIDMDNMEGNATADKNGTQSNSHCLESINNELHNVQSNYDDATDNLLIVSNEDVDDDAEEEDEFEKLFGRRTRRRRGRKPKPPTIVNEITNIKNDSEGNIDITTTTMTSTTTTETINGNEDDQDIKTRLSSSYRGRRTRGRGSRRGSLTRGGSSRQLKRDASKMEDDKTNDDDDKNETKEENEDDQLKVTKKRKITNIAEQLNNAANAPPRPNIVEYQWPQTRGSTWCILQEHISEYLGVVSFKRKYPSINRRPVEYQERQYLLDQGCVTEVQCDLGLTVLNAEEVLQLMSRDYPDKYQEYTRFTRKRLKLVEKPSSGVEGSSKLENVMKKAIRSAAEFNASLSKERRHERTMYFDLQTMEIQHPIRRKVSVNYSTVNLCDSYPVALVPGQYQHYYKRYTPTELNYFPLNTALYTPHKMVRSIYVDPNLDINEPSDDDMDDDTIEGCAVDLPAAIAKSIDAEKGNPGRPTRMRSTTLNNNNNNKKFMTPLATTMTTTTTTTSSLYNNEDSNTSFSSVKKVRKGGPGRGKKALRCGMCDQTTKNKYNEPDDLVKCNTCNVSNHPGCLGLSAEMVPVIKTYNWQCMECKVCYQCTQPHDEDKMMFCDHCDRGYHTYCVGLNSIPDGRWDCIMCSSSNHINNNHTNDSNSNMNFTDNSNSVMSFSNDNSNTCYTSFQNTLFKSPISFSTTQMNAQTNISNNNFGSSPLKPRRGRPFKYPRDESNAPISNSPAVSMATSSLSAAATAATDHLITPTTETTIIIDNDDEVVENDNNDNMSLSLTCENDVTELPSDQLQSKRDSNRNLQ